MRLFLSMNVSRPIPPRYQAVAAQLREEIRHMRAGDYLASEQQLAARFAVNRHTVRRALDELVADGQVLRQQGRGSQVLDRPVVYPLASASAFSHSLSAQGHQVEATLIKRTRRAALADECRYLQLKDHPEVLELTTLRVLDGKPLSVIRHCFAARFEALLEAYQGGSLRQFLAARQWPLTRALSLIGARHPTGDEAKHLLMPKHAPVLTVLTLSQDVDGQPVELAYSSSRADRFQYQVAT